MLRSLLLLAIATAAGPPAAAQDFDIDETVAMCAGCHGEDGVPIDPEYPVIRGQQYFYIFTQLRDYGAGRRENDTMTPIAAEFDRDQAKQIAEHFAALPWAEIEAAGVEEGDYALVERGVAGGQCSACHGEWQGDSRIPRLAGQQQAYLAKTMLDFKNEIRLNAPDKISTMQHLDDATIEALSRYLSSL
jgi:cytochrome c553